MKENNSENNQDLTPEKNDKQKIKNKKQKVSAKSTKKPSKYVWAIKIGVLTLALSLMFGVLSELVLSSAGITISVIIIVILMVISIVFDMIGVGFAACSLDPLVAMSSKKVRGSREAIKLVKNADKVSSFCSDVVGDICGILSGAAGGAITLKFIINLEGSITILIASVVSAVIAALTVFGKAMCKKIAIDKSVDIALLVGKILSVFTRNK